MFRIRARVLLVLSLLTGLAGLNYGATITLAGPMSGANENPVVPSPATGFATVTLDTVTQLIQISLNFNNLTSNTVAAHIHCCIAPPGNAGVATVVPAFPGFPLGVTSGTYSGTLDLTQSSSYNPAFITSSGGLPQAQAALVSGLENNLTYLNIHTTNFPGGEIRAFLAPVPEPSTFALAALALTGAWVARRRRAK
jgi:hypothetical protein